MNTALKIRLQYGAYDFSNSGFLIIFQSLLFPIVLSQALIKNWSNNDVSLWGWLIACSSILAIVGSPVIGKLADHIGRPLIFQLLVLGAALGGILSGFTTDSVLFLMFTFLILNTLFELSQNTYDAFLPRLTATSKDMNTLSAFAWGFGYLGGALFVGLYFVLDSLNFSAGAILSLSAVAYFFLSIPAIKLVRTRDTPQQSTRLPLKELLRVHPPVAWSQLIIYWLIADAVAALTYFLPLYLSRELNLDLNTIGLLMIGGQLIAFPATVLSGKLVNRFSHHKVISASLLVWLTTLGILISAQTIVAVTLTVIIGSLVFGTTQATMRSHFAHFLKPNEPAQGFGFYAVAQKSASVAAPAIGALLIATTGRLLPVIIFITLLIFVALILSTKLPHATIRTTTEI